MLSLILPLYYQLTQVYQPARLSVPTPTPTSIQVLGVSITTPPPLPAIGGEGQMKSIALFGDSMINTLSTSILEKSLQAYFPTTKFNLYNYGYSSTNLEQAIKNLDNVMSQNPDIVVVESFAYNNFGNSTSGLDKHSQLLSDTIKTITTKLPSTKIILAATIAPNSVVFANGVDGLHLTALDKLERTKTIRLYLDNTIKFAQKHNLPLLNAFDASLINNQGFLPLISSRDHLHPSEYGQQFFGDLLAKTILDHHL